ncbi:MAG: hypothetical protein ABRQ39_24765 [Candidatus Eremiobacterota bacterium]
MKINNLSLNKSLPYTFTVQKKSVEPKDTVEISFSALSETDSVNKKDISPGEIPSDNIDFCFDQHTSNPLSVAGHVSGGTTGTISRLPLSPEIEFKSFIKSSRTDTKRYLQDDYKLVDPKGDAYLIGELDQVPRKLIKALYEFTCKNKDNVEDVKEDFTIGHKKPIKTDALANKIIEIIQEHPEIEPKMGEEHKWSPEAQKYLYYGFWDRLKDFVKGDYKEFPAPLLLRSKFFLLLACGYTNRYMVTGKEGELEKKLLSCPDGSLQIHDVFRESYILNKGDIYLTLLTAENTLAKNPYKKDRDEDPLQKKLSYIRNDSKPLGDKYGGWYHFFGAALYGLLRSGFTSKSVVITEAFGSLFLEGPDRQETLINVAGADFGNKLKKMLKNEQWKNVLTGTDDRNYMDLSEFTSQTDR